MEAQLKLMLKPVFDMCDINGDGTIVKGELYHAIVAFGHTPPSPTLIEAIFWHVDKERKGYLDFNQFVEVMLMVPLPPQTLKTTFEAIDKDGNGYLAKEDLKPLVPNLPDPVLDIVLANVGGEDGRVSFEEFSKILTDMQANSQAQ